MASFFATFMSKKMAGILIGYSVLLVGLGWLLHRSAPEFARVVWIAAAAGGAVNLLWGIAAFAGMKRRVGPVLTTIPVAVVMLFRTVDAWMGSAGELGLGVRLAVTALMAGSLAMLTYLIHGERSPEFYNSGPARPGEPPLRGAAAGENRTRP